MSSSPRWRNPIRKRLRDTCRALRSGCGARARGAAHRARRQVRGSGSVRRADPRPRRCAAHRAQSLRHRSARRADPLCRRSRREGRQGIAPPPPPGSWRVSARAGDGCVGQRHHAHRRRGSCARSSAHGRAAFWDHGSARVSGFEILPIAELDHPRVDVTLAHLWPVPRCLRGADRVVRRGCARHRRARRARGLEPACRVCARAARRGVAPRHRAHLSALRLATTELASPSALSAAPGTSAPISASIISPRLPPLMARASTGDRQRRLCRAHQSCRRLPASAGSRRDRSAR